jgi:hypothetical protein
VEALQFHSNTQSHWSSESTVCFQSRGVSGLRPGDARTHNGIGFLLLALSRYIGDPDVIDHWPCPRLCADNGMLHWALCRWCEKPAVITHAFPWFHSTPCRSSSSSQYSDWLEPRSSCWGEPCGGPAISLQHTVSLVQFASRIGGQPFSLTGVVEGKTPHHICTY